MKPDPAPAPRGAAPEPSGPLHAALLTLLLMTAGALSVGTSKSTAPAAPPPTDPGPSTTPPPPPTVRPGTGPGATPGSPIEASLPSGQDPCVGGHGSTYGLPALPAQQRHLPDGLFHGYLYTTAHARECGAQLPEGEYRRCAVDRGRVLGCGPTVYRTGATVYCQDELFKTCRVDASGHVKTCGEAFSGWTVTEKRGALRRCCVQRGKIKYCTNDADYVCTDVDQRRLTPQPLPRPLPYARPAPLRTYDEPGARYPVSRRPLARRGSYQRCDIFNGRVSFCRGWYHGQAVVFRDGAYRSCRIFNGQISHCGSWYQGQAVAFRDGAYRSCRIFNGQISHCGTWFRGGAAVYREE